MQIPANQRQANGLGFRMDADINLEKRLSCALSLMPQGMGRVTGTDSHAFLFDCLHRFHHWGGVGEQELNEYEEAAELSATGYVGLDWLQ